MIQTISTWQDFQQAWEGGPARQNFLLRSEMFTSGFTPPPLEAVVEAVRRDPDTRILKTSDGSGLSTEHYPEYRDLPLHQAMHENVSLAHFDVGRFAREGQVFEGLNAMIDRWYANLAAHGFKRDNVMPERIFFQSAAHCNTGYHYDSSFIVAYQAVGRKRFCWLKDPDRWCPHETLAASADLYELMRRPDGITPDDVIECEMQPGDVLWNIMLTPHWVYSLDEISYSFNLTHYNLRYQGRQARIQQELEQIREARRSRDPVTA